MNPATDLPTAASPLAARLAFAFALSTCCLMFPLVFVGAGVTSRGFGMAFPDWPTSGGAVVNPSGWWQELATRWEHGHRLIGWAVGILATGTMVTGWVRGGAFRTLGCGVWFAVAVQGVLGGLRVRADSRYLAMVHGISGQLVFCLTCATVLVASRRWSRVGEPLVVASVGTLRKACLATNAALVVQLVLGAMRRHLGGDHVLVAHLLWAVVVGLFVGWVVLWVIGQYPGGDWIETLGWMMGGLMALQLALGGVAWAMTASGPLGSSAWVWAIPTLHVAVGALLLASSVLMTMGSFRFFRAPVDARGSVGGARVAIP